MKCKICGYTLAYKESLTEVNLCTSCEKSYSAYDIIEHDVVKDKDIMFQQKIASKNRTENRKGEKS